MPLVLQFYIPLHYEIDDVMNRIRRIENLLWNLDEKIPEETLQNHLSAKEKVFLVEYDRVFHDYMIDCGLDLTKDLNPPKNLYIEIRILKDCEVKIGQDTLTLISNSTHYVRRQDVEALIRTGEVEHISDKLY